MFWILRRTGAANFFNSLNNNCSTSKGSNNASGSSSGNGSNNNNKNERRHVKRPPRRGYGRLNCDGDEATTPIKQKVLHKVEQLEMTTSSSIISASTSASISAATAASVTESIQSGTLNGNCCSCNPSACNGIRSNMKRLSINDFDNNNCNVDVDIGKCSICGISSTSSSTIIMESCTFDDCPGDCDCIDDNKFAHLRQRNNNDNNETVTPTSTVITKALCTCSTTSSSICGYNRNINHLTKNCSDDDDDENDNDNDNDYRDDDYDESLTCNVCDRTFHYQRQLASHQQKKRHFGCSGCDNLFPSLMSLEHHKEEFEHWSDNELHERLCCRRSNDYFADTDSFSSEAESEDLERLL